MTLVYLLLLANLVMLAYLVRKVRVGVGKVFNVHNEVRDLRRYDLTELAREVQAGSVLGRLLDLEIPLPPLGGWAASADFLVEVAGHVRRARPETVVELGSGASTLVIARMLQQAGRGHLYSLDHDAEYAARTRELLEAHGLAGHATVIHAPLVVPSGNGTRHPDAWYSLDGLDVDAIDLLVIDGPPEVPDRLVRHPAGPALFPRLREGGIAIADDTRRESGQETVRRWAREFPELSVHETQAGKGYAVFTRRATTA